MVKAIIAYIILLLSVNVTSVTVAKSRAIILFGPGRSGTTWLMEALESIDPDHIFVFGEPFYAFREVSKSFIPKYYELFSCTAFVKNSWRRLLWSFSCNPWRKHLGDAFHERCLQNKATEEDRFALFRLCRSRPIRIVKTVRYAEFLLEPSDINQILKHNMPLRFVYTHRNANDVISSRYIHGWQSNGDIATLSHILCYYARANCNLLKRLKNFEDAQPSDVKEQSPNFAFKQVEYESLTLKKTSHQSQNGEGAEGPQTNHDHLVQTWKGLKDFLNLPYSLRRILQTLEDISNREFARIELSPDAAERAKELQENPVDFSKSCSYDLYCQL